MAKKVDPIKEAGLEVKLNTPIGVGQYLYLEQPDFEYNSAGDWKVKKQVFREVLHAAACACG